MLNQADGFAKTRDVAACASISCMRHAAGCICRDGTAVATLITSGRSTMPKSKAPGVFWRCWTHWRPSVRSDAVKDIKDNSTREPKGRGGCPEAHPKCVGGSPEENRKRTSAEDRHGAGQARSQRRARASRGHQSLRRWPVSRSIENSAQRSAAPEQARSGRGTQISGVYRLHVRPQNPVPQ